MRVPAFLEPYLPCLEWGRRYNSDTATNDGIAALVVMIMLIPQSLAYAMLAGLPPEMGLYASILPLIGYALFGTSNTLAVGPVAVVSLMTAAAIGQLGLTSPDQIVLAAITLAFLSGIFLLALGVFKLGFLANFLSHPVIAGFMTASVLIIAASQFRHLLGIQAHGHSLFEIVGSLFTHLSETNVLTLLLGMSAIAFLYWVRSDLKRLLIANGWQPRAAGIVSKAGPFGAVIITTLLTWLFGLDDYGVAIVGTIPTGFPPLSAPSFDPALWSDLVGSAILISIIGFLESISVAQTLAAKRRQRIVPDQELIGLGVANLTSAASGGYPVTGGFSRSVVNFDAGAETPAAGVYTAIGIAISTLALTPLLFFLPKATLAAIIVVAVLSLVDFSVLTRTWSYSKTDFTAVAATILTTLWLGVEVGISVGAAVSIGLFLYKTSRPHMAEVGLVPGTEHFRNIERVRVITSLEILTLRVDESLYFANARFLEDSVYNRVADQPELQHVILMCSAVNEIDSSALESLEEMNRRLLSSGVKLHLSEVKGPVMDRLKRAHFLDDLTGMVFLSQFQAATTLDPTLAERAAVAARIREVWAGPVPSGMDAS
ncbi:MAG: sulfate permease [Alphaproteobacteria bacterium]|nr:sulfate permease [Alphaproteobacteria bacterium]